MQTSQRKVTLKQFISAKNVANEVMKNLYPRTRLAHHCEEFLSMNEKTIEKIEKEQRKLTEPLSRELRQTRIDNAVEKDGVVVYTSDKSYAFNRAGEAAVLKKQDEITEKLQEIQEPFLAREIDKVNCICSPLELPKDISYDVEKALNGFVFKNKSEFSKESK